jgi:BON domain
LNRTLTILVLFASSLVLTSRISAASAHKSPAVHQAVPADAQIESTIRTKLAKSKIGKDGLRFRVSHGVVTWEGSTNVMQHKGAATRMAHAAGAQQVVNNIQVSAAAKAKAIQKLKKASVQG